MSSQSFIGMIVTGTIASLIAGVLVVHYTRATEPPKHEDPHVSGAGTGTQVERPPEPPPPDPPKHETVTTKPPTHQTLTTEPPKTEPPKTEPPKTEPPKQEIAKTEDPALDPKRRAALVADLNFYAETLDADPGDRSTARKYADELTTIAALHDTQLACDSLTHWQNYAANKCAVLDGAVLKTVDDRLDALRAQCPKSALDHAMLRCPRSP